MFISNATGKCVWYTQHMHVYHIIIDLHTLGTYTHWRNISTTIHTHNILCNLQISRLIFLVSSNIAHEINKGPIIIMLLSNANNVLSNYWVEWWWSKYMSNNDSPSIAVKAIFRLFIFIILPRQLCFYYKSDRFLKLLLGERITILIIII